MTTSEIGEKLREIGDRLRKINSRSDTCPAELQKLTAEIDSFREDLWFEEYLESLPDRRFGRGRGGEGREGGEGGRGEEGGGGGGGSEGGRRRCSCRWKSDCFRGSRRKKVRDRFLKSPQLVTT